MPPEGLRIGSDGRSAELILVDVPVIDQPGWPDLAAGGTPARLSFKVVWSATGEQANIENSGKQFRFNGWRANAQMEAEVVVPSTGFRWKSDSIETSRAGFAVIGREVNGRYFTNP